MKGSSLRLDPRLDLFRGEVLKGSQWLMRPGLDPSGEMAGFESLTEAEPVGEMAGFDPPIGGWF